MIEKVASSVLEPIQFSGTIKTDTQSFPVTFTAKSGADFHLEIEFDPVPAETYIALQKTMGRPGASGDELTLAGHSNDEQRLESSTIAITGHNSGGNAFRIKASHRSATITCRSEDKEYTDKPAARLWLRGFETFRNLPVDTNLGKLAVRGDHQSVTQETVSGCITIKADVVEPEGDWFTQVDDFLNFMMRGLGFAHGGRLQTPRCDQVTKMEWKSTFYSGTGFQRYLPAIHNMRQEDFIKALAKRYENQKPFPDMLWTAIGWLHANTTISEVRFLNMMTALETIVENVVPKTQTTILPKPDFKPVRTSLEEAIGAMKLADEPSDIFMAKIAGLNIRSLSHKIEAMKGHFSLSDQLFSNETVKVLTKTRNSITHKGVPPDGVDIQQQILLVREMIAMVIFSEIGYQGAYESYAEGYQTRFNP